MEISINVKCAYYNQKEELKMFPDYNMNPYYGIYNYRGDYDYRNVSQTNMYSDEIITLNQAIELIRQSVGDERDYRSNNISRHIYTKYRHKFKL